MCLFLCQYHIILITVALKYTMNSGDMILPGPFFFLKIVLAIGEAFMFHTNLTFFCIISVKTAIGDVIGIALNVDCLG